MTRGISAVGGALTVGLAAGAVLLGTPVLDPDLSSRGHPAASYDEALARLQAVQDAEAGRDLRAAGHSKTLLTGAKTSTAVVLFHGLTSVPDQFRVVARAYRDQGHNVWVPRLPFHGETNLLTDGPSRLTAEGLRDFADLTLDIAAGLGARVIVVGLSAGGSLALWSVAARPEVSQAVLISPLLLPAGYADWQLPILVRALRLSPVDRYAWWDPAIKDAGTHPYNYPRYSLKGMAAVLGMAQWVAAAGSGPVARSDASVVLVRNDGDPLLDSAHNESVLTRLFSTERLRVVRIPASAGLAHDLVCAHPSCENYAHLDESYRYLSSALGLPLPDPGAG